VTTVAAEPLAAWDVGGGFHKWEHWAEAVAWNKKHLPDRGDDTYRLEFYLVDAPFAKAFRYAVNSQGRWHLDPATGKPAVEEPVTVLLSELPPPHLRCFQRPESRSFTVRLNP